MVYELIVSADIKCIFTAHLKLILFKRFNVNFSVI